MIATVIPWLEAEEVQKALDLLVEPGQVFEVRVLEPRVAGQRKWPRTMTGYFNDTTLVPGALTGLHLDGAMGFYLTLNPVNPVLLTRSCNRFSSAMNGQSTADKDILCRRWLLLDCDPVRPAGVSASNEEKSHAQKRAFSMCAYLQNAGWPEPAIADSGNGTHVLYRIDLPSMGETVKLCLEALCKRFNNGAVSIDTSVSNPARIVKLYGTRVEKGDHCPTLGRPHRFSRLLSVPRRMELVAADLLEQLAAEANPKAPPSPIPRSYPCRPEETNGRTWDKDGVQDFIDRNLSDCSPEPAQPYDGGYKWVLGICPFNSAHNNRSAVIVIKADGMLGFKCHHNGCNANSWRMLRAKFEPVDSASSVDMGGQVVELPRDKDLVARYGPPLFTNPKGKPVELNQMFCAGRFSRNGLLLHDPALGTFYSYDPSTGLWKPKTQAKLMMEIGHSVRDLLNEYGSGVVLRKRTESLVRQILGFLKGITEKPDAFSKPSSIIHVGNGMLDLSTSPPSLKEFSPGYYSRNRSEVLFKEGAKCSRFLNELLLLALSEEDVSILQRYAGQCLLGQNPSQKILLLCGTPNGGKSTVVNVLEAIIGPHNVAQLRVPLLDERFEIAAFVGKTLLTGKDVPGDFLNCRSAGALKALVGGDVLNAEQKHARQRFDVPGCFNILVTSNTRLHVQLDGDSGAWRRRLLIINYEHPPVPKPIPNFDRLLMETEGSGILNWCIEGACRLLNELNVSGHFQLTAEQSERIDALLGESDSIKHFAKERITRADSSNVTVRELQAAYYDYCGERGWQAVSARQFENRISSIMMDIYRAAKRLDIKRDGKNQRGFAHLKLRGA